MIYSLGQDARLPPFLLHSLQLSLQWVWYSLLIIKYEYRAFRVVLYKFSSHVFKISNVKKWHFNSLYFMQILIVFLEIWWLFCEIFCHQFQGFPNRWIKLAAFWLWNTWYFKYCYFSLLLTVCSGNPQQSYVLSWCSDLRSHPSLAGPLPRRRVSSPRSTYVGLQCERAPLNLRLGC